jgi:hypothetical protein
VSKENKQQGCRRGHGRFYRHSRGLLSSSSLETAAIQPEFDPAVELPRLAILRISNTIIIVAVHSPG